MDIMHSVTTIKKFINHLKPNNYKKEVLKSPENEMITA